MSRSYRKNPISSNTCAGANRSEKKDKIIANKKFRRMTRNQLSIDPDSEDIPEDMDEVSNIWNFTKDGKSRWDMSNPLNKKVLRK